METTPEAMQSATPTPGNWKIMMAESGIGMFFLRVCLFLINLITLFLAVPWTTVMSVSYTHLTLPTKRIV